MTPVDLQGFFFITANSPLLLTYKSGNFEIAEILVVAGAGVSAANTLLSWPRSGRANSSSLR
jgi:hypothetical protein